MHEISIAGRKIGWKNPAFIVAELSGNHNGSIDRAVATVRAAAASGADAIKFQTYTPDTLTIDSREADFLVPGDGPWGNLSLYELYKRAFTPWEWHARLFEVAREEGLIPFSTPFDSTAVALLEELETPAYKIASFELPDDELLRCVAKTGKPVIISTGLATLEEIAHAVDVLRASGCTSLAVLRCASAYPASDSSIRLSTIPVLRDAFNVVSGLSDHTIGTLAPVAAVLMGASIIEKHLTLDTEEGVDAHFSAGAVEFRQLVGDIRRAESMIGTPEFGPSEEERQNLVFRRSLYIVDDMKAGDPFSRENVRAIRPGYGLAPRFLPTVLNRRATRTLSRGTRLGWEHIG
jgi:pseudaminic acid synthase